MNTLLRKLFFSLFCVATLALHGQPIGSFATVNHQTMSSEKQDTSLKILNGIQISDSVQTILKNVDSLMRDSLSKIVIAKAKPFVPGRDGMIFDNLYDFFSNPGIFDFSYINRRIPYHKQLEIKVKAYIEANKRLHFNIYRHFYQNSGFILNPYKLSYLTYHDYAVSPITQSNITFATPRVEVPLLAYGYNRQTWYEMETWNKTRDYIAFTWPAMIDIHWNNMPDPPTISDTIYMPLIQRFNLNDNFLTSDNLNTSRRLNPLKLRTSPWKIVGMGALQANQTFVQHWAKGGENSVSLLGIINIEADYTNKDLKWENDFELKLGAIKQEEDEVRKNDDRLKISSKVGYKAFNNWFYTANFDFETQLFNGYDLKKGNFETPISGFLSPAKTYLSLGMDYKYKKSFLSVFASPLTFKNTLVIDTANINPTRYGVEKNKISKTEAGAYIKGSLKWEINSSSRFESKIYLFSNYIENPQNVDVEWEGNYEYRFSQVFSFRFSAYLKYDDDEKILLRTEGKEKIYGKRLQIKQLMSIGLLYRF
jgi:hypothetical protein